MSSASELAREAIEDARRGARPDGSGVRGHAHALPMRWVTLRELQPLSPTRSTEYSLSARSRRSASPFGLVRAGSSGTLRLWDSWRDDISMQPVNEAVVRLLERPGVYLAWQRPFVSTKLGPVWRHNDRSTIRRVLDVGCGPGTNSAEFDGLDYLGVDLNPAYIDHARRKHASHFEVADVRTDSVPGKGTYDFVLVNSLLHHLDDVAASSLLGICATTSATTGTSTWSNSSCLSSAGYPACSHARIAVSIRGASRHGVNSSRNGSTKSCSSPFLSRPAGRCCGAWCTLRDDRGREHPRISVAIAVHDEEEVFPELVRRLAAVLDDMPGGPHEIVFVDDGSTDRTFNLIVEAAASDTRVVGVRLSRNFGHQAALTAALETVTGDVVIAMDGDLQDRPEEIPRFVAEYEKGYDVVYAQRVRRKESHRAAGVLLSLLPPDQPAFRGRDPGRLGRLRAALSTRRRPDQPTPRASPLHPRPADVGRVPADGDRGRARRPRRWPVRATRSESSSGSRSTAMFAFSVTPLRAAWLFGACVSALASLYAL